MLFLRSRGWGEFVSVASANQGHSLVIIECVAQMQAHGQIWATGFRPELWFGFREREMSLFC